MFSGSRFFCRVLTCIVFFYIPNRGFLLACNLCKSKKLTHHRYPRKRKMTSTVSVWFAEFLKKGINDLPCRDCRYAMLHMGGCRANSYAFNGEMWDRDPVCCTLSPFIESDIVPSFQNGYRSSTILALQEELLQAKELPK